MLYLIGMGLYDERDISLKGLDILKDSDRIYAEFYTNIFWGDIHKLKIAVGKEITVVGREDIEENPGDNIFRDPKIDVALLVPGDPMVATTHSNIILEAHKLGIKTRIIHASSIYTAVSETGLQTYKFGKTTTVPFPQKNYFPTSPYHVLRDNLKTGLHTLLLLDVRAEDKHYMSIGEAADIMLRMEEEIKDSIFRGDTFCVGVARLGGDPVIKAGNVDEIKCCDFGKPPHALIVPGRLHFMEKEMLELYRVDVIDHV